MTQSDLQPAKLLSTSLNITTICYSEEEKTGTVYALLDSDLGSADRSTTIGWIGVEFGSDIHGPQRMSPTDFGDPLTFLQHPHRVHICGSE